MVVATFCFAIWRFACSFQESLQANALPGFLREGNFTRLPNGITAPLVNSPCQRLGSEENIPAPWSGIAARFVDSCQVRKIPQSLKVTSLHFLSWLVPSEKSPCPCKRRHYTFKWFVLQSLPRQKNFPSIIRTTSHLGNIAFYTLSKNNNKNQHHHPDSNGEEGGLSTPFCRYSKQKNMSSQGGHSTPHWIEGNNVATAVVDLCRFLTTGCLSAVSHQLDITCMPVLTWGTTVCCFRLGTGEKLSKTTV